MPEMHVRIKGIRAFIHLLSAHEGGRKSAIATGYRPSFWWDGAEDLGGNDGQITFAGQDSCEPGANATISVEFYHPELLPTTLRVGTGFRISEGGRTVGRGSILELLQ